VLEHDREDGKQVVLANGCFDILHVGHIRYLQEASEYGDILVVAINDDEATGMLKGDGRPVIPADERAELLAALKCVDYLLIFPEMTVDRVIRELSPEIHAKGTDYDVDSVPELKSSKAMGCRTVITGDAKSHSSGDIIRKLRGKD